MGKPRYSRCNIHIRRRNPVVGPYLVTISSAEYADGALEKSKFDSFHWIPCRPVTTRSLSTLLDVRIIHLSSTSSHILPHFPISPPCPVLFLPPQHQPSAPQTASNVSPTASLVSQTLASRHTPVGGIVGCDVGGLLALVLILIPLIVF